MTCIRLKYQTIEFGNTDIHLCGLRNKQEFHDPDGIAAKMGISSASWPIFGILWPSSIVLAKFIQDFDTDKKRILEVGCGLGLTSLMLNKQGDDITATDHHPEVNRFLKRNTTLNNDPEIPFERVDWTDKTDTLGLFDLIIGSDLLYEDEHIELLAKFIESHALQTCQIVIVDPGRGRKAKLVKRLSLSGFSNHTQSAENSPELPDGYKGYVLIFTRVLASK
ncbi:class I SAM-dependent methyltransferase [Thalassotalea sp. PS06]|uniref:class I SAM-dependent methyltransferase n=1 Tax=Thalassotalea sp. PS06 TaxID=2594005 RepID=UPI0011623D62|nr:methyltransferase domain-containing protein [Thalassotalea sp. PS06]QDP00240.1 methyltransferase domain-containing protein [Thalassotalea sp. PS06]